MAVPDLGANRFTFAGDRTYIVFDTQVPGPIRPGEDLSGGQLEYQGPEGNFTFYGNDMTVLSSLLGTLLTITLKFNDDTGGITFTLLIPHVFVNEANTLNFETLAIKASSRGFIEIDGPELTYSILPMLATASHVLVAL